MKEVTTPTVGVTANLAVRCLTNPPQRILVVDDDFENRQVSSSILAHSGYEVDTAANGAIAWQALNVSRYDLLITNYKMTGMSGVELLMKLHAVHRTLPVIMAAATLAKESFARYPWLNPATMLFQPCSGAELLGTVNQILYASQSPRVQVGPTPIRQAQSGSQWFADMMVLLRSPVFR